MSIRNIRTKTKRRLAILVSITLVLVVTVVGLFLYRSGQQEEDAALSRAEGVALAKAGNYVQALPLLSKYVGKEKGDVEAMYLYALCRRKVDDPRGKHLAEPLYLFREVLNADPNHKEARDQLLELYNIVNYNPEAIELADQTLAKDPKDFKALLSKSRALERMRDYPQAMIVAEQAVAVDPQDIEARALIVTLMKRQDQPVERVLDYAQQLVEKNPEDPRFEMLMGYAHALANDRVKAAEWLRRAAEREMPSKTFVRMLIGELDKIGMYNDAMALLSKHAAAGDNDLKRFLARRLLENGDHDKVLEYFKDISLKDESINSDVLGIKAVAHLSKKDLQAVEPIIATLDSRSKRDPSARAWAVYLRKVRLDIPEDNAERIEALQQALTADPSNPFIRFELANSFAAQGETELAITEFQRIAGWDNVGGLTRTWAMPLVRLSQILNATNRPMQAIRAGQFALLRAPTSGSALMAWISAKSAAMDAGLDQTDPLELLKVLEQIQKAAPGEEQTLPMYVELLMRTGRVDDAAGILEAVVADEKKSLTQGTVLRLAVLARQKNLPVADKLFALTEKSHGITPTYALARAAQIAQDPTQREAAVAYFQQVMSQQSNQNQEWQMSWARLLDTVNDDRAKSVWMDMADKNPKDVRIQRAVLNVRSVQSERAFMGRTIERVRSLSDGQGLTWRLARGRWLLANDATQEQARQAVTMLTEVVSASPDLVEARLLLAAAHQKVGNRSAAIEQLTQALSLQPERVDMSIELARLRLADGDIDKARELVDPMVSGASRLTSNQRQQLGRMLVNMGDNARATQLLESTTGGADLTLAELYLRQAQLGKAEEVYRKLMADKPSAMVVRAYANFLAATNRNEEGLKVLATLKTMPDLPPGGRELIMAEYNRRFATADMALEEFRNAAKVAPDNVGVWRSLVDFLFAQGRTDEAMAAVEEALAKHPDDPVLSLIKSQSAIILAVARGEAVRPLISSFISDDENREASLEAMRLLHKSEQEKVRIDKVAASLRQLSDRYADHLVLATLTADLYMTARRFDDAIAVSMRAMQKFPNDPTSAERATRALAAAGRWNDVLVTGQEWRQRSLLTPMEADASIAEAMIATRNPAGALKQIERYQAAAEKAPERYFQLVALRCSALVTSGQVDQAATILKPLLPTNPAWRNVWMTLALRSIGDAAVAASWLDRVEPTIPRDSYRERMSLATNWYALGVRSSKDEYRRKSLEQLKAMSEEPEAIAEVIAGYGVTAYQFGDLDTAEAQYRKALKVNPQLQIATNNLALLIADRGGDLAEALSLARSSVEANPSVATYYDTLAHVNVARKEFDEAIANLRKAVELEPESPDWRINLAKAYMDKGDRQGAKDALLEFESLRIPSDRLTAELQERLKLVRSFAFEQAEAGVNAQ